MTTLPLAGLPLALPGMLPLPGTVPTPHDPAADPFLALLTQLTAPSTPEAPAPVEDPVDAEVPEVPTVVPAEAPDVVAEAEDEPGREDGAPEVLPNLDVPALPVPAQLPVIVPPTAAEPPTEARPVVRAAFDPPTADTPAPAPAPAAVAVAPPVATLTHRSVSADAPPPQPVARQVFPEVVRAAVTGVTPNRVVVRLEPEHLGEVRVVLRTDRSGTLEVSLAGGPDARAAMREGAPELRRLLEAAGSHDAKVVVRHLAETTAATATTATTPVAPTTPTTTVRTDVPTTAGGPPVDVGAGSAGGTAPGTSQGEGRRGRDPQDARPGATDGMSDRTVESTRPADRRNGGLDVMM